MNLKDLLKIDIATEANNYEEDTEDKIWIQNGNGNLVQVGGEDHESITK